MKLVMTLLVRDEEEILRENIEFHLAQGVDHIIATDNCSADATPDILKFYERQGVLTRLYESGNDIRQYAWVTRMARLAFSDLRADWVINNDADEFWWPRTGSLREVFAGIGDWVNALCVQRTNFVCIVNADSCVPLAPFHERMIYRDRVSLNPLGKRLPPKMAHRAHPDVHVSQGNHDVNIPEKSVLDCPAIEIFHFPLRSYGQLVRRVVTGGQAYERNTELAYSVGITIRELYRQYMRAGNLHDYFARRSYMPGRQLQAALEAGRLVEDTRLRDCLRQLDPCRLADRGV